MTAAVEIYPLIPRRERAELRPIIWQKILAWRRETKGQTGEAIEAMNRRVAEYSRLVRKEEGNQ